MVITIPLIIALPLFFVLLMLTEGYLYIGLFETHAIPSGTGQPQTSEIVAILRTLRTMTWVIALIAGFVGLVWVYAILWPLRRIARELNDMVARDRVGSLRETPPQDLAFLGESLNRILSYTSAFLPIRTRSMLERISSGVLTLDTHGKIESMNRSAAELLEIDADQAVGHLVEDVLGVNGSRQQLREVIQATLSEGEDLPHSEIGLTTAEGRESTIGVNCAWVTDAQGRRSGLVVNLMDAQRMVEISAGFQQAEKLSAVGALAAGVAHDIRNPLATIKGLTALLREQDVPAAKAGEYLQMITEEVEKLNAVVTRLMAFARPEYAQDSSVDIEHLLLDAAHLARGRSSQSGVKIEIIESEEILPKVHVQRDRLMQAVLNVIDNGLRAAPEGGWVRLQARPHERENAVVLEVANNGPMIAAADQEWIFRPYFTTREDGLGLGLTITCAVIEEYGGHVEVDSATERTVFRLVLPTDGMVAQEQRETS
jgi:PAS domain S-box-containing protein